MHTYPSNELIGDVSTLLNATWWRKHDFNFQGQTGDIVVDDKAYIKSTEWEIVSKQGVIHEVKYDCCPAVYQATYSIIRYI